MKKFKFVLLATLLFVCSQSFAQSLLGSYEQVSIIAPDEYKDSEHEVTIKEDPVSKKKIWIENLIPNQSFYAIKNISDGDTSYIYAVPPQLVGNYQIKLGCVIFESDDEEAGVVSINLNNKTMCQGISQKDYQTEIEVGDGKVKAGGVEVDKSGKVKAGKDVGVDKDKGIKISTKKLMSGIQYVGRKVQK